MTLLSAMLDGLEGADSSRTLTVFRGVCLKIEFVLILFLSSQDVGEDVQPSRPPLEPMI
jgi:hypothetical protein